MKKIFSFYSVFATVALSGVALTLPSPSAHSQNPFLYCGTYSPTLAEIRKIEYQNQKRLSGKGALIASTPKTPSAGLQALTTIDVYVHVITKADRTTGDVTNENVQKLIDVLNDGFAGNYSLPNGVAPLGPAANTRFRFALKGIDRTANDTWYVDGATTAMKSALRRGDAKTLNVYLCSIIPNGLVGYAVFPWWYAANPIGDGVVYDNTAMPGGTGSYGSGRVLVHEVGHWAGLYHTFQGSCEKYNDFVADTPAEAEPFRGDWFPGGSAPAAQSDTCTGRSFAGKDPNDNQMDYSADTSRVRFTPAQSVRMSNLCRVYRGL